MGITQKAIGSSPSVRTRNRFASLASDPGDNKHVTVDSDFFRELIRSGVERTEALLSERDALKSSVARLRAENEELTRQLGSDDQTVELMKTIATLKAERHGLEERASHLKKSSERVREHVLSTESELSELANLYVATRQLYARFTLRHVFRNLRDIVGQLIGAEAFVVYAIDGDRVRPITKHGVGNAEDKMVGEGRLGEACQTGLMWVRENSSLNEGTGEDPVAIIPLSVGGDVIGAIVIHRLLEQKAEWSTVDQELIGLLGSQAGNAIVAAALCEGVEPRAALTGLFERI